MSSFTLIADDYAMTAGVSRGILRLLEHGRISGTGAMTGRPHWKGWSHALRAFAGKADLGVHLNLTLAEPLTRMAVFAPSGVLPTIGEVAKRAALRRLPMAELKAEIAAQLDAFEQAMDRRPDFIDGHQHVHGFPGVRRALFEVMLERYPKSPRPWLRASADLPKRILARRRNAPKAFQVAALSMGFAPAAHRRGIVTNDGFAGFSAFDPTVRYADEFASALVAPGLLHLVMCHPGEIDDELRGLDPVV
ncbi:MAG: ChbG/HpnK family deacetylase, partial [Beijerinckiaceae bacterium]